MQLLERNAFWLLKADSETPEALTGSIQRVPRHVISTTGANNRQYRPPRGAPLVVTREALHDPATADLLVRFSLAGVRLLRPHEYYEKVLRRVMLDELNQSWLLFDRVLRRRPLYTLVKAIIDLVTGVVGSLLTVLLIPVIWLVNQLEDGGPVFYRQERVGLGGRTFYIWKFRTMRVDAELDGPVWASVGDARVTRLGRVLRSTHLDELPQFFNVLRRQMSLIGPRPERPAFIRLLSRAIPFLEWRHLIRPGVTGWAVVRFGYSDSIRDKWIIHEHDLYYLKRRSFLLDLEIAARTVLVMLSQRGQ